MPESASVRRPGPGREAIAVGEAQARRIAVRPQLLDGSATRVLETVRRLGFLQLDRIAVVAPHSTSSSEAGSTTTPSGELERALLEWDAFVWPVEDLPLVRGPIGAGGPRTTTRRRAG